MSTHEKKIGYARVSSVDQDCELQRQALQHYGCDIVISEKKSAAYGKQRPLFKDCLTRLGEGDTLVVAKLDRLSRSWEDFGAVMRASKTSGFKVHSLAEAVDFDSPIGRLLYGLMGLFAEFERDRIVERTQAGAKAARARGIRFGRRPKLNEDQKKELRKLYKAGWTYGQLCDHYAIGKTTVYRILTGKAGR